MISTILFTAFLVDWSCSWSSACIVFPSSAAVIGTGPSVRWFKLLELLELLELVVQPLLSPPYHPFHQAREGHEIESIDSGPL